MCAMGNRGHVGIKKETTWGTRVAGDNDVFLPFVSEGLTRDIEEVVSAIQRGVLDEPRSYQGQRAFGGPLVLEVHPVSIGHILRSALGAPAAAVAADSVETELENCDDAWVHNAAIYGTVDVTDKKEGAACVKLIVPEGTPDTTILAYKDFAGVDMSAVTALKFWIKTSIDLAGAADLEILFSETGGCAGVPKELSVGTLTANVWKEVTVATGSLAGADWDNVVSVGLRLGADLAEFTVRIDDIRAVVAGTADVAKKHVFTPMQTLAQEFAGGAGDTPLFPYTFEIFKDEGQAYEFLGCVVNTMNFSFSVSDKIMKANLGIIAKNAGYVDPTVLSLETTNPFVWENAKIYLGGVTDPGDRYNDIESFTLNWDNKCAAKYSLNNTAIPRKIIRTGYRDIPISFTVDFTDKTEYNHFLDGTERQMRILFQGAKVGADAANTPYTLQFDIPLLRYTAWPVNIGGPGRLSVSVTGKAKYDAAGYALLVSLINDQDVAIYAA